MPPRSLLTFAKFATPPAPSPSVKAHGPVPEQAPDQPVNSEPESATAVSVIAEPSSKRASQEPPQMIPAGALDRGAEPPPVLETLRVPSHGTTISLELNSYSVPTELLAT